jgi:hypothetical protein
MKGTLRKYANAARIFLIRQRIRRKAMDLHALSAQQIADLYLGDAILGEIRTLQAKLDICLKGERPLAARMACSADDMKQQ